MAYNSMEDNESIIFATPSESHSLTLDNFFDLGSDYPRLDTGSATASDGSFSNNGIPFGDLGHRMRLQDKDFYPAATIPFRRCGQDLILATPVQFVTRLQRLNHARQQEGIVISGAQLMALENKDISQASISSTRRTYPIRMISPNTPPTTPQHGRTKLASSTNERTNCNIYQTSISSNLSQSSNMPARKPNPRQVMALATPKSQQDDLSASYARWTERLRNLAVQSPPVPQALPISPPPSTKVEQSEIPRRTSGIALLDLEDDDFEPFSSTATATSSNNSKNPFWDDSSTSTMDSSPWNLDAPVELFGLKEDTWDMPPVEAKRLLKPFSIPREETRGKAPNGIGLGVTFGSDDLDDNLLGLSHASPKMSFDYVYHDTAPTVRPVHQDQAPSSKTCSPALVLETPTTSTTIATGSSSAHNKSSSTRKHRRTKSAPSLQSTSRGTASGQPRGPRTPRSRNTAAASNLAFVNFTPDDRTRILTGVAPSGSSKTKARREKEAQERRKKLSEAARRLVFEAGGDVDAVERELSD